MGVEGNPRGDLESCLELEMEVISQNLRTALISGCCCPPPGESEEEYFSSCLIFFTWLWIGIGFWLPQILCSFFISSIFTTYSPSIPVFFYLCFFPSKRHEKAAVKEFGEKNRFRETTVLDQVENVLNVLFQFKIVCVSPW